MQPPARHWIDRRWGAIGKVFPTLTMDWIYGEHSADRLKHHKWMLTRPTFRLAARGLHQLLAVEGDVVIGSVNPAAYELRVSRWNTARPSDPVLSSPTET